MIRQPYRAGSFYEADERACARSARQLVDLAQVPADLPATVVGGLVPHAGWPFSGALAALTLKALAQRGRLSRVVVFGADHWGIAGGASVYDSGSWRTPLGLVPVDEELASALLARCPALSANPAAHAREHSIEVQLPIMQVLCPEVRVVPINVSPEPGAVEVGRQVGQVLREAFPQASVVGSTDLTHYGPGYGFVPGGTGPVGLEWAKQNDRRLLKLIEAMRAERIVDEANTRHNACGGGAIAATMAAAAAMGAAAGHCLGYTTSADVMASFGRSADEAVGYAAVVFA